MTDEYWIISVPRKSTARQTYDEVCQATGRDQLAQNFLFTIPDLKVRDIQLIGENFNFFHLGWNPRFVGCSFG